VLDGNHACIYKPYGTNCTLCGELRAALSQPAATGEGDK
jgi:hypothetical protein